MSGYEYAAMILAAGIAGALVIFAFGWGMRD